MIMSHVARTFVARHCADLAVALHYARISFLGTAIASVVTDAVASFASDDRVIGGKLLQMDPGAPWVLQVKGIDYHYVELSNREGTLILYDREIPDTAIAHIESRSLALTDIIAPARGQALFYLSHTVRVQRIVPENLEHPYRGELCTALRFELDL